MCSAFLSTFNVFMVAYCLDPIADWFERKGFPQGKLGMLLQTMHVVKTNGLDEVLKPIKEMVRKDEREDFR